MEEQHHLAHRGKFYAHARRLPVKCSADSVCCRWTRQIDPSLKKGPWTPEEDANLLRLFDLYVGEWSLMVRHMGGRGYGAIFSRYHSLTREPPATATDPIMTETVAKPGTREWKRVVLSMQGNFHRSRSEKLHCYLQAMDGAFGSLRWCEKVRKYPLNLHYVF